MLVVLKLKDKQNPDKVWDDKLEFVVATQDATTVSDYMVKFNAKSGDGNYSLTGFRSHHYSTNDKKAVIHIYIGSKELWEFDWTNHWQPHIDKNLLEIEKLVEADVFVPTKADGSFDWNNLPTDSAGLEMKRLVDEHTDKVDWNFFVSKEWTKVQPLA